jgi:8-oxo-dGTP pyrophosphatase MutT (NUDIX family)
MEPAAPTTTRYDRFLGGTIDVPTDRLLYRPSAYGLILSGEKILLLRYPADPRWTMPGGAVEKGERIETALRREIKEETGIEARVDELIHFTERFFYYDPACEARQAYLFYYRCTPLDSNPSSHFHDSDHNPPKATWVNIRDMQAESFQTDGVWMVQYLAQYLEDLKTGTLHSS